MSRTVPATGHCSLGARSLGTLLTVAGVLALSPDALLLRLAVDVDPWTGVFYRGLLFAVAELAYILVLQRDPGATARGLASLGALGVLAGCVQGASQVLFTVAILSSPAANVLVLSSTNPVFAALFSYALLGEVVPRRTMLVIVVAIAAILIVVSSEFGKMGRESTVLGNLCALGAAAAIGLFFVLCRIASKKNPEINFIFCNVHSGLFMALVALCAGGAPAAVSTYDWSLLLAMGLGVLPVAFTLLTVGPQFISAPEVSLYTLIETVLAPVLVYAGGFEAPPERTVYGGSLLMVALLAHGALALREEFAPAVTARDSAKPAATPTPLHLQEDYTSSV